MFRKYNSIENAYRKEYIDRIIGHGFGGEEYVVQEKAHGANFSFYTNNGIDFLAAKRTGPIEPDEIFYNCQAVIESQMPKLQMLWAFLKESIQELEQLNVFGELIGGTYKHPDVPRIGSATVVQKGVFYAPSNEFYAFDILINNDYYLSVDEANACFEKCNILYAKTLFQGSLDDCLAYPNDGQSTLHEQLDLPKIENNVMEGVVIKPTKPCFFNNLERVLIKNKNEKWEEVAKASKNPKVKQELPENIKQLQQLILGYISENRMNNVVSKIGEFEMENMGKVLAMFAADVVEDFMKDHGIAMDDLDKKEQKEVTKLISKPAVALIKKKMDEG